MSQIKDLTKEAPTSPRVRTGGYALLSRMADKGRADLQGKVGEYHFACPLDQVLFEFKGVKDADVKKLLETGASDADLAAWLEKSGTPRTAEEIKAWSDSMEAAKPYENPEKKEWFVGACEPLGIDPAKSTLFDMLEADDKASFKK
ncbi:MAG: DUF5069 domain-containing protein [Verrucomicrobium sp.]|nr:DUF5069 domain-containing protein [Verrucomicrobium sp.]